VSCGGRLLASVTGILPDLALSEYIWRQEVTSLTLSHRYSPHDLLPFAISCLADLPRLFQLGDFVHTQNLFDK